MTQSIRDLRGDAVLARDGRIGSVDDVYFDDERWAVRYVVVDTGEWLSGRRVLIAPASVESSLSSAKKLRLALTREQIASAPPAESDRPVSRRYEIAHAKHYGYPHYWAGPMLWGVGAYPIPPADEPLAGEVEAKLEEGDPHLRSGAEVIGYAIEARDGAIGEVEDFLVDEKSWAINDIVVDTLKWWPGGHVRVHPEYVERIDWSERKMHLRLTREQVKLSGAGTPRS